MRYVQAPRPARETEETDEIAVRRTAANAHGYRHRGFLGPDAGPTRIGTNCVRGSHTWRRDGRRHDAACRAGVAAHPGPGQCPDRHGERDSGPTPQHDYGLPRAE